MDESIRFVNTRCVFRNDLPEANVLMLTTADLDASG